VESAITFCDGVVTTVAVTLMCTTGVWPFWICVSRSFPTANVVPITGRDICGGLSVPLISPTRSGELPSLKMITPIAPLAAAFSAFCRNVQVPRWTSAMLPATEAGKSASSQPLVEPPTGGSTKSFVGTTAAVTSPEPEYSIVRKSVPSA
jgi:hypothetical protein